MKTFLAVIVILLVVGGGVYWYSQQVDEPVVGGQRDSHGCLGPAGYGFDTDINACVRSFELTPDIAKAAQIAVAHVGAGYALTVVRFNSYEELGAYDIMLERGIERTPETVQIRNWMVVSE